MGQNAQGMGILPRVCGKMPILNKKIKDNFMPKFESISLFKFSDIVTSVQMLLMIINVFQLSLRFAR